jgi:hypothetical protein
MSEKKRRSKLELQFEEILKEYEAEYGYEVTKIPYTIPAKAHTYTVDWTILNGVLIETKGWIKDYDERMKYEQIKKEYPDIDLRFVFANPNKFCGGTKMPHWKWAEKVGYKWCSVTDHEQIKSWIKENNEN